MCRLSLQERRDDKRYNFQRIVCLYIETPHINNLDTSYLTLYNNGLDYCRIKKLFEWY